MEIFLNLWNNWTNIEKISLSSLSLILFILLPLLILYITRNKKFLYFTTASLLSTALLTISSISLLNIISDITITYIFLLLPIIVLFIYILSLGTCVGYYQSHRNDKSFNFNQLKKEYFSDTIYISVFILLLFPAFSVFTSSTFLTLILLTTFVGTCVVWLNYTLFHYIVKLEK